MLIEASEPTDLHDTAQLVRRIAHVEERLRDLQARMPAHSVPPAMQWELDELEDELAALLGRLRSAV